MDRNNNDKYWRTARFILLIGSIIVAIVMAYTTLKERVNYTYEEVKTVKRKSTDNEKAIIEIKTDLKYIKSGIDEIKREVKQ